MNFPEGGWLLISSILSALAVKSMDRARVNARFNLLGTGTRISPELLLFHSPSILFESFSARENCRIISYQFPESKESFDVDRGISWR